MSESLSPERSKPSRAQVRANRRNARQSTGPRTIVGKRRASLNALAHGVFCKDLVLAGENQDEFDQFAAQLLGELKPQGWVELIACEQYVEARWRIRRVRRAERAGLAAFDEYRNAARRPLVPDKGARKRLGASPPAEDEHVGVDDLLLDAAQRVDGGACERWGRMQQRLEMSAERALRQLRQLRKDAGVDASTLVGCPFLDDETGEEEEPDEGEENLDAGPAGVTSVKLSPSSPAPVQNEPNSGKTVAGDGADGACAHGSRTIEVVAPTKLAPTGAVAPSRDGWEESDRA